MQILQAPVTIVGGGIAGLWTYRRLQDAGIPALLIEAEELGNGQTIASQGMVHGGQKYALQGRKTPQSEALKTMPQRWDHSLRGDPSEAIDLSQTHKLSDHQILWTTGLLSSISSFFASKTMNARVHLTQQEHPAFPFQSFKGQLYHLQEKVLDMSSLLRDLARDQRGIIKGNCEHIERKIDGSVDSISCSIGHEKVQIKSSLFLFTAGLGNELICDQIKPNHQMTQRRPLKQIMIRGHLPSIFGHCITADPRPRITITTHQHSSGDSIWYLGGLIAEKVKDKNEEEAIPIIVKELNNLFPWHPWSSPLQVGFLTKIRAEASNKGQLHDSPQITHEKNWVVIWPTKMTFAPAVGDQILKICQQHNLSETTKNLPILPKPSIALPPWETCEWSPCII
ncbi:MAG: FAD-dependent oxidoreductase [Oligoflexales bacterium]